MNPSRWRLLGALYHRAAELAPEERSRFLGSACEGDATLQRQVESLLRVDAEESRLAAGIAEAVRALDAEPLPEPGERVGPYRILREIGRGGMGRVYLAERDDEQFRRRVAVKVVSIGLAAGERRFRRERQILAGLEHPHIARLYDGGVSDTGLPYLVMEFVEGVPITGWCAAHRLGIAPRVALFLQVCSAVQFAHGRLVVHRDLKPANILVTGEGKPMLLDFGIAKLLRDDEDPLPGITRSTERLLTPEYASPEQVRGEPVGVASDVYSLGVVLYEILAEARPYEFEGTRPSEIERVVCETEPPRPSTRASRRGGVADALPRRLRGDLDTIVMKALRKDPRDRYLSVEQLGADLERHLQGHPVLARAPTWRYRAGKALRRHWKGVAAASAIAAILMTSSVVIGRSARRAERERDRAEQVSSFLKGVFQVSDPSVSPGESVTARAILDEGAQRILDDTAMERGLRAELLDTIGSVYRSLGLLDPARDLLQRALDERRGLYGEGALETAITLDHLASVLQDQGEMDAAEPMFRRSLEIRRRRLAEDHLLVADAEENLGVVLHFQGKYAESEPHIRRSLAVREARLGRDNVDVAVSLSNLASSRQEQGDFAECEALNREALAVRREALGAVHPEIALSLDNLAYMVENRGEYREAEALYRESIAMKQTIYGGDYHDTATSLNNLGVNLHSQGRYDEADSAYAACRAIRLKTLGENHRLVATDTHRQADLLLDRGRLVEGEALARRALELKEKGFGPTHASTLSTLVLLGSFHEARGDLDGAQSLYGRALAAYREQFGDEHVRTAGADLRLASVARKRGLLDEAETLARKGVSVMQQTYGRGNLVLAGAEALLGLILAERGKREEALPLLETALAARRRVLPAGHRDILDLETAVAGLGGTTTPPERRAGGGPGAG